MGMNGGWTDCLREHGFAAVAFKALAAAACSDPDAVLAAATGCCSCFAPLVRSGKTPVFNPHHADVLLVAGAVTEKAAPVVRRLYDQMPAPKYVIAFGNCAITGGMFGDSYAVTRAADIVPVDVCVTGCPPDAAALIDGIDRLRALIRREIKEG